MLWNAFHIGLNLFLSFHIESYISNFTNYLWLSYSFECYCHCSNSGHYLVLTSGTRLKLGVKYSFKKKQIKFDFGHGCFSFCKIQPQNGTSPGAVSGGVSVPWGMSNIYKCFIEAFLVR